ncbi:hypothetical protein [Arthrobacter sp. zg-Y1143]|uniref:hypothetical protein n=1 Tax=Arthrobacter sp. zg-Y1143 TaxID=3049065 RepID=UPI0024C2DD6E|nr:hypothetical protein [Arthrobacter sp. zg-Y1143]MDK1329047.1 hypothetical protein [Arthrobacter sp. zg-Y1143]
MDRGVTRSGSGWKTRHGDREVTYYLEEPLSERGRNRLTVVFSAISGPYDFTYNYRSSLAAVDAYRLYVLDDFGAQGSYYYADHRDTGIFSAVQSLLRDVSAELGIRASDTSFAGSSKGGTAALAHGLVFGAGRIIAGAPQCFPGSYLRGASSDILGFIAGDESDESVAWLDRLIPESIDQRQGNPQVTVLVGQNDSHLHVHVQPFMELARQAGIDAQTLIVTDVDHQNIGSAFGPYLAAALQGERTSDRTVLPYQLGRRDGPDEEVQLKLWLPPGEVAAVRIISQGKELLSSDYSASTFFKVPAPANRAVQAQVSRMDAESGTIVGSFETVPLAAAVTRKPADLCGQ